GVHIGVQWPSQIATNGRQWPQTQEARKLNGTGNLSGKYETYAGRWRVTGSQEVVGSTPISSTNKINNLQPPLFFDFATVSVGVSPARAFVAEFHGAIVRQVS